MCGIFGYVGHRSAQPILIDGLSRLEYRGYDSAGIATVAEGQVHCRKQAGRIDQLVRFLREQPAPGHLGIAHTRWASHGKADEINAHPHLGRDRQGRPIIAVVHNGVIENHDSLRRALERDGFQFTSETDSEVIAQLIACCYHGDLLKATQMALQSVRGTYGLAVISSECPDTLMGACCGSPLVIGLGAGERFLSSDQAALEGFAEAVVSVRDHQVCILTPDDWQVFDDHHTRVAACARPLGNVDRTSSKGVFAHYMLKEIHEQPLALENALRDRLDASLGTASFDYNSAMGQLRHAKRLILTGCGTSYHAGLLGEYLIEEIARLPVEVEYASEFRYRNAPLQANTVVVALSQSGETADTLAALREAKKKQLPTLALCNVPNSTIAHEADGTILLHAGPEIGVASSKAFTNQVAALSLLALYLGRYRGFTREQGLSFIDGLKKLPNLIRQTLECEAEVVRIAATYSNAKNALYLGRGYLYPIALEGALKLKEVSYIHAEGYPAAEMKHGPIALVDQNMPSIFLMSQGELFDKVLNNLEEIKARGGPVIGVTDTCDVRTSSRADALIRVPKVPPHLQPFVSVVPLQLLAYHMAVLRGCDIDRPRNLAKSVTVE